MGVEFGKIGSAPRVLGPSGTPKKARFWSSSNGENYRQIRPPDKWDPVQKIGQVLDRSSPIFPNSTPYTSQHQPDTSQPFPGPHKMFPLFGHFFPNFKPNVSTCFPAIFRLPRTFPAGYSCPTRSTLTFYSFSSCLSKQPTSQHLMAANNNKWEVDR